MTSAIYLNKLCEIFMQRYNNTTNWPAIENITVFYIRNWSQCLRKTNRKSVLQTQILHQFHDTNRRHIEKHCSGMKENVQRARSVTVEAMHCFFLRWKWLTTEATPIQFVLCVFLFQRWFFISGAWYRWIRYFLRTHVNILMIILANDDTACHIEIIGNRGHLSCVRFIYGVFYFMYIEAAFIRGLLVGTRTVQLFSSVNLTMLIQLAYLSERLVTIRTCERLFTSVNSTMHIQGATLFELLVTVGTCEWLFTSVTSTMHIQFVICFELLVTVRTYKLFSSVNLTMLIQVDSTMTIQIVTSFELLVTIRTDERPFHPCEFYDVYSNGQFDWTSCHNQDRRTAFHRCEFYDVYSNCHFLWTFCHSPYRRMAFHRCEFYDVLFNVLFSVNFLSQSGQANGFSPVWILRCLFKLLLSVNFLSQSGQTNSFSPVWILRWLFNLLRSMNCLSQYAQSKMKLSILVLYLSNPSVVKIIPKFS